MTKVGDSWKRIPEPPIRFRLNSAKPIGQIRRAQAAVSCDSHTPLSSKLWRAPAVACKNTRDQAPPRSGSMREFNPSLPHICLSARFSVPPLAFRHLLILPISRTPPFFEIHAVLFYRSDKCRSLDTQEPKQLCHQKHGVYSLARSTILFYF